MDYEKKYKEALERASKLRVQNPFDTVSQMMEHVFPELKESEDEKIRKNLIGYIKGISKNEVCEETKDSWIAWLEKQQKTQGKSALETAQEEKVDNQNCVKPADKVEPKFKVGDTIRPKGSLAEYTIESISGECYHGKGWGLHISCDDDYELVEQKFSWSEEDEKFFKTALWHISYSISNGKSTDFHCDTTEWLKSLKDRVQPQPKQEWNEEDEERLSDAIFFVREYQIPTRDNKLLEAAKKAEEWLEFLKDRVLPHQEWSEDDETVLSNLIWALKEDMVLAGDRDEYVSWLQSLKDKTIPQPKQEWSDEEEEIINIEENLPHKVSEVICINCKHRWIAVRPEKTLLKSLECPECQTKGFVIETGEIIDYE